MPRHPLHVDRPLNDQPATINQHNLDPGSSTFSRKRRRHPCLRNNDRRHEPAWYLARHQAAPGQQQRPGYAVAPSGLRYEPRPPHALQHDPALLLVRPTTATPGLDDLKAPEGTVRMAVHTDSAQRFASDPARWPTPDAYAYPAVRCSRCVRNGAPVRSLKKAACGAMIPVITGIGVSTRAGVPPEVQTYK